MGPVLDGIPLGPGASGVSGAGGGDDGGGSGDNN